MLCAVKGKRCCLSFSFVAEGLVDRVAEGLVDRSPVLSDSRTSTSSKTKRHAGFLLLVIS